MIRHHAGVVVGVKNEQRAVLAAAVRQARMRDVPLTLVHAYDVRPDAATLVADELLAVARDAADEILDQALGFIRPMAGELSVTAESLRGRAGEVLSGLAGLADLLVVGAEGHRFRDPLCSATVAYEVSDQAQRPVLVVPTGLPSWREHGSVTVVLDEGPPVEGPMSFALAEARRAGTHLVIVRLFDHDAAPDAEQDPTSWLETFLGRGDADVPDVAVRWAGDGESRDLCIKETANAALVVMGKPDRRSILHPRSDASSFVLAHAEGPVAVVPTTDRTHA